jgi:proline iminopeptidase
MNDKLYNQGHLRVSDLHEIWYGQYGHPQGHPILWLHGGPGAGCVGDEDKYFDTSFYRVILLDQRGAGKSRPFCELRENNTQDLISDIEALRKHLNITKWSILGGSWGSLLALCYAMKHHDTTNALILRGVYTATDKEAHHLWHGIRDTFPDAWQELYDFLTKEEKKDLAQAYIKRILSDDKRISLPATKAFIKYNSICSYHEISERTIEESLSNENKMLALAKIFMHYFANNFFIHHSYIADNLSAITHLPCIMVHGRYDTICKPSVTYDLHKSWPNSILHIVPKGGHTPRESAIEHALKSATDELKRQYKRIPLY